MAEGGRGNGMAFIVGGLVVAVAVLAWFAFGNGGAMLAGSEGDTTSVTITTEGGDSGGGGEGGGEGN